MPKFLKNSAKTLGGLKTRFNALLAKLQPTKNPIFDYELNGNLQELKEILFLIHIKKPNNFLSYLRRYLEKVQKLGDESYEVSIGCLGLPDPNFSFAINCMSDVYHTSRKYGSVELNSLLDLMYLLECKYDETGDAYVLSQLDALINEAKEGSLFQGENLSRTDKIQWYCHLISQELRQESPNKADIAIKFQMCNLLIGQQENIVQRDQNWINKVRELKLQASSLSGIPSPAFFKEQVSIAEGQGSDKSQVNNVFNPLG